MRSAAAGIALILPVLLGGCGLLFPGVPAPSAPAEAGTDSGSPTGEGPEELPVGLGTLRQDEVSVTLRRGGLQIRLTPLGESIVRLTAPDTFERLSALGRGHQEIFTERTGAPVPFQLFLVSLFSEATEVAFDPDALTLVNRGLRYRPIEIRAVTPGWDARLLMPREPLLTIYAFSHDLDLEQEVEVEYQEIRSRAWQDVLSVIQREEARVRSRARELN